MVMKKADLILGADFHLRETVPVCRSEEEFLPAQWEKVKFVKALQEEHDCPVLHAGDLFHHWKPSPHLLSSTIAALPAQFWTIYGQHDLPQHNFEERHRSGIYTLEQAGALKVLNDHDYTENPLLGIEGTSWGKTPYLTECDILVWHKMVWQGKRLWPEQTDPSAMALLKKYKDYDLIITGDNHKPFTEELDGKLLVNPGSLMRQSADQIDHLPRVYLYYASDNTVTACYLPISSGVVSREHISKNEERSERIDAFISKLDGEWQAGMSFEANLEEFFKTNRVRDSVKAIIYKAIEP